MMGFGLVLTILVIGGFIYLLNEKGKGQNNFLSSAPKEKSALDIVKERYARGEISKEEFDRLRLDLDTGR